MRIAVPVTDGVLAQHFGHCEKFALIDVDMERREITATTEVPAPEHQPGLLPPWLKERGVQVVIAGGMGTRAQTLFKSHSMEVLGGVAAAAPEVLVRQYLDGQLVTGSMACHHG